MKFGVYYSGGLDATYNDTIIRDIQSFSQAIPATEEYAAAVDAHYRELIEKYRPDILWNDICLPHGVNIASLLEYYYSRVPEGVVNDRFRTIEMKAGLDEKKAIELFRGFSMKFRDNLPEPNKKGDFDFLVLERNWYTEEPKNKWELVLPLERSHFFNREETEAAALNYEDVIRIFIEVFSNNGNLLLSIGPDAMGKFRPHERGIFGAIGDWFELKGTIRLF